MGSVNGVHPIERTLGDHLARTDRYLFRWLEQNTYLAMQLVANAQKQMNSAEHHCHVAVVATGMHNPFVPRREGELGLLQNGQRIHVGSKCNATARLALFVICIGRGAFDGGNEPRPPRSHIFDTKLIELFGNRARSGDLTSAQFGIRMEVAPPLDNVRLELSRMGFQLLGYVCRFGGIRVAAGHNGRLSILPIRLPRLAPTAASERCA